MKNKHVTALKYYLPFVWALLSLKVQSQCTAAPPVLLGSDSVLCTGQVLNVSAPAAYESYLWSGGQTTPNITISSAGDYIVVGTVNEANLVVNGDFELGNNSFTTDYVYGTGGSWGLLSTEGQYAISSSPSFVHNNFMFCDDHTPAGTNMLIVNGSGFPNTVVWSQTIPVTATTDYLFSCWVTNALSDFAVANLQFYINGIQLGPVFYTSEFGCDWLQFNESWNSGANTSAVISIINQNTSTGGNDFALDDITFNPVCHDTDTITVSYENITVSAGSDVLFCENAPQSLVASSNLPGVAFTWSSGESAVSITPSNTGTYTVTGTSGNGCQASDAADAGIIAMDWNLDQFLVSNTSCALDNGSLGVVTSGTFEDTPSLLWTRRFDGTQFLSPGIVDAQPGWYDLVISSMGCIRTDSVFVAPSSATQALVDANHLTGTSPLEVTFSNNSLNGLNYIWKFAGDSTQLTTDLSDVAYTFTEAGNYDVMLIAVGADFCVDTTTILIHVNSTFVIYIPNSFSPNGDEMNNTWKSYSDGIDVGYFSLIVYNRWGEILWENHNPDEAWDGTYHDLPVPEGFYTWKLECKITETNEIVQKEGHVFIIR